jgi:hypothetical protein
VRGYGFIEGVPRYKLEEKDSRVQVELMKQHVRTATYKYEKEE